jgi:hypothetical protein
MLSYAASTLRAPLVMAIDMTTLDHKANRASLRTTGGTAAKR